MADRTKYFIGNWKMFGLSGSYKILERINSFIQRDKKNNKKYKVIIAPPFTLLDSFSKRFKGKKIKIAAQNCYEKDNFGAHTGSISPFMIKKTGVNFIILGHSENRALGEDDKVIKLKVSLAIKNKLNVIFCIGENKKEKKNKQTLPVLKRQILSVLKKGYKFNNIIIAYEPVWSIGSGRVPSPVELKKIVIFLKKFVNKKIKSKIQPKLLYGGSVDKKIIYNLKSVRELDGFLIGGASKSSKNFIDIIKNFYK